MKKILTAMILASTLLAGCGYSNVALPDENLEISAAESVNQESAIKYGTVLSTQFIKDHNGDHYRFNHITVKYITDTDVYENLAMAYSLDNQGVVFIWLTRNPGEADEQHEMIDSGDMAVRKEMAAMLKTMRIPDSKDKANVSLAVSILEDFVRNKSVTSKSLQARLMKDN
jgi:hypothetical protein